MAKKQEWDGLRLSPTSILTYLRCPRDFYYKYVERLPQPVNQHLIKGNIVHGVLEEFFAGNKYQEDLDKKMTEIFDKVWEDSLTKWAETDFEGDKLEEQKQDCLSQLDLYLTIFKKKMQGLIDGGKAENARHAFFSLRPKMREVWVEDKELRVCGYIDRIHKDFDGDITIGDYKTSSRYGIGIKEDYEIQCGLYALLYKRQFGELPNWVSIIFMRYGEEVMTRVTPHLVNKALELIQYVHSKTTTDNIEDYPCSQSKLCSYSPWFDKKSGLCDLEDEERRKKVLEALGVKEDTGGEETPAEADVEAE